MKNIVNTINSDNKNIFEGFFDNVNANPFKVLDDFLKENKNSIVTLKGKDYLIHNLFIYDVNDLRAVVRNLIDRATIKNNKDLKKYRMINSVGWSFYEDAIIISYKFYTLINIETGTEPVDSHYKFDPITTAARKDEYLIDFLKKIAK